VKRQELQFVTLRSSGLKLVISLVSSLCTILQRESTNVSLCISHSLVRHCQILIFLIEIFLLCWPVYVAVPWIRFYRITVNISGGSRGVGMHPHRRGILATHSAPKLAILRSKMEKKLPPPHTSPPRGFRPLGDHIPHQRFLDPPLVNIFSSCGLYVCPVCFLPLFVCPLPSSEQLWLEDNRAEYQNCSVLYCVPICMHSHMSSSYRWSRSCWCRLSFRVFFLTGPVCLLYGQHMCSRNKINSVLATIFFISAPSVRTCGAEIK